MRPIDIKNMRKVLGLNQKELAKVLGCSIGAVESYEQGKRKPSEPYDERLERLAKRAKKEAGKIDTTKASE
jgi:DNA-binding transcriptional regulator YiaG